MRKISLFILAVCLPMSMLADVPVRIARMQEKLPCHISQRDTIMQCQQLGHDISINIEHDRRGDLSHLGLHLFTPEMKQMSNHDLCNCVERTLLEILLLPSDGERTKLVKEYKLRLMLNGYPLGSPQFRTFSQCLNLITVNSETSFKELEDGYEFRLISGDDALLLYFPKDREVIFGTDKKEQDELMTERLALGTDMRLKPKQPKASSLKPAGIAGLYKSPGKAFLIEQMRSDIYYIRTEDGYKPVFDRQYMLQSYTNFMLGQVANPDMMVDLTHKRYGLTPPRFNVDWASLYNTLVTPGTECYAAARLIDNDTTLSGVLIISHGGYGYIDMLTVNIPIEEFFTEKNPEPRAYLFTNVPQNNVLNLFE